MPELFHTMVPTPASSATASSTVTAMPPLRCNSIVLTRRHRSTVPAVFVPVVPSLRRIMRSTPRPSHVLLPTMLSPALALETSAAAVVIATRVPATMRLTIPSALLPGTVPPLMLAAIRPMAVRKGHACRQRNTRNQNNRSPEPGAHSTSAVTTSILHAVIAKATGRVQTGT